MSENNSHPPFLASEQLLFGIVALQFNLISREQLVAAFDAWVHDKSHGLADILVLQGALSASDRELLDRLVAKFLEKHAGNAEASLAALSSASEVRPQLERLGDADLAASLHHVGNDRALDETVSMLRTSDGSRGRFRIVRPHAQGGLGQVSVAIDQELNREVALKEILPKHADDPFSRDRFVLEAEITGGLEHPGIVPVYALGQAPDGRPFYAMRFIKGDSLKTAIEAYHSPDNPNRKDPGARQLELRQLLGRFIDVCNAMEYAHSRGVLHRDLKPGNIMVGKYGETLVVDWGLAKAVGRKEIISDEASLKPATALTSSGQTQPGSAVGTPAYMSPEQARGDLDQLGPASDVYSLGATLYHLLCGKPPFDKEQLADMLPRVQRGDFPKPRTIAPDSPPPLESICLRAMSLESADRYPTPRALADDIEHWLADEPVTACADPFSAKVARWSRKHRGWVQAGSIATVLLLFVTGAFALVISEKQRQTKKLADEKTQLADEKTQLALEKGQLAEKNEKLFQSERAEKILSEERAANLKRALIRRRFEGGIREYADGRPWNAHSDLMGVLKTATDDSLRDAYLRVIVDRASHGGRQLMPPMRHSGAISCVALNADGSRIVTGSADKSARLWDVRTGRLLSVMRHERHIQSVALSPDGQRVVTGSNDRMARLWDASGRPVGVQMRHGGRFKSSLSFSPDGTRIVSGSDDQKARLWDGMNGQPIGEPMTHEGSIECIAFSPDGTRVITGSYDGKARLWNGATGALLGNPMQHGGAVNCVAFSPDGARVVTGSADKTARLWDGVTGLAIAGQLMQHGKGVTCAEFSPDGTRVVTGSEDGSARVWDGMTGDARAGPLWHEDTVNSVAFSPDGQHVATGSDDRTAQLWDAATQVALGEPMRHREAVSKVAFTLDGAGIVTASRDGTARLWNGLVDQFDGTPLHHEESVYDLAFSPDGSRIVTAGDDKVAKLRTASTGKILGTMQHQHAVTAVQFSRDGSTVLTKSLKTAQLWNGITGEILGRPMIHRELLYTIAFSPDGARVLTVTRDDVGVISEDEEDFVASLWNGSSSKQLSQIGVSRAAFSPDGTRVVTVGGSIAKLWDGRTGQSMGQQMQHEGRILDITFNPDGKRLLTGSEDNSAGLWNGVTGQRVERMQHKASVFSVMFSPDGMRILTASSDGMTRLWNGATGRPLGEPLQHESRPYRMAFSPDGSRFAVAASDTVRVWETSTGQSLGEPMRLDGTVHLMAFSPDGWRLVASGQRFGRMWEASTGQPLGEPMWHSRASQAVFSPNGGQVVTQGGDGGARLWDVPHPDLDAVRPENLVQSLELWTGVRCDIDGNARQLSFDETEQLRTTVGDTDFLAKFQLERFVRCRNWHHRAAASEMERAKRWFAAAFHLRELLKLEPNNSELKTRLDNATQKLAAPKPDTSRAGAP